jgi:hypothetical protein
VRNNLTNFYQKCAIAASVMVVIVLQTASVPQRKQTESGFGFRRDDIDAK